MLAERYQRQPVPPSEVLVANGVVNTMPQATLAAVADHGSIRGDTIRPFYTDAHQVLRDIAAVGIDYDDVVDLLEDEGITKFEGSWALVTAQLSDRLGATPTTSERSQSAAV